MLQENVATISPGVVSPVTEALFSKILVATDFSPASDLALEHALSIARRFNSKLYLMHVVTVDGYPMVAPAIAMEGFAKMRKEAEAKLAQIEKSGRLYGVARETIVEEGTVWGAIEYRVGQDKIDLVVVGTHGAAGIPKMLIGSAAEQVFRQARVPVLTVGPRAQGEPLYESEFRNILFATDFGPGAEKEAAVAFALAQQHHARITLLNVAPYAEEYSTEAVEEKRREMTRQLKELVPAEPKPNWKAEFVVVIGEPVEEILGYAGKTKADLIVMGAKFGKGLSSHLQNTKAYKVVCAAKCPVLTLRS